MVVVGAGLGSPLPKMEVRPLKFFWKFAFKTLPSVVTSVKKLGSVGVQNGAKNWRCIYDGLPAGAQGFTAGV